MKQYIVQFNNDGDTNISDAIEGPLKQGES
jgi:hypothetical protein